MSLKLTRVTRRYPGSSVVAVDGIDLEIADGTLLCLLGPSGCGKTTTLRMIAGLDTVDGGAIELDGRVVDDPANGVLVAPEHRNLGLVFQHYALWPHMRVQKIVEFGLVQRKVEAKERKRRVAEILERLSLSEYANRYPSELSGGQQQRVATARTLVTGPKILLMDEPLSNLDTQLRSDTRETIRALHREFGCTTVFVTHDQAEAMALADQVAVMHGGKIAQLGAPLAVYDTPQTLEVARFIGTPPMNILPGDHWFVAAHAIGATHVGVRPEALIVSMADDGWTVRATSPTGTSWIHMLEKDGTVLTSHSTARIAAPGDMVAVRFDPVALHRFGADGTRL